MTTHPLNHAQQTAVASTGRTLLIGPAGTGKTTALQQRLHHLLAEGEPAYTILVLVAEPKHKERYTAVARQAELGAYADLKVDNYVGLAREFVELFWPLVARRGGFASAHRPPTWLSYDLAQLHMWEVITPMLEAGHFANLRLRPQQIVSQLLDNLNRSALNNHTLEEGIQRQINAWAGDKEHIKQLFDARTAAQKFRAACHAHNLLDLSLGVELFSQHIVGHPEFARYFRERFRHFVVDNLEEQTAAGQRLVETLLRHSESATLAFDTGGGYKTFLAADPKHAARFGQLCQTTIPFEERFVDQQGVYHIAQQVDGYLFGQKNAPPPEEIRPKLLGYVYRRYRREMLIDLAYFVRDYLAQSHIPPSELAIIVPYLDGALRYKLTQALREAGVPYQITRRRASPREEAHVRTWLTFTALAHPDWHIYPSHYDVAEALQLSLYGLDPVRAALVAQSLYEPNVPRLRDTLELTGKQVERIGEEMVNRVELLRRWLLEQGTADGRPQHPLPTFLHKLFTELLAQPEMTPVPDVQGAAVCDWLVRTAERLTEAAPAMGLVGDAAIGKAFLNGIYNGLVTADPPDMGEPPDPNGVRISTIYGFLLGEWDVQVQVWLETAATGWWDMPRQPLSNTFVLAESWQEDQQWTLEDDVRIRNELLSRVVHGLTSRCRHGVILATSELDRRGARQEGPLWRALHPLVSEEAR